MEMPTTRPVRKAREHHVDPPKPPLLGGRQSKYPKYKESEADPHEYLAPSSQETDKGGIICMPATPVEVREEGMRCLALFCIFAVEGFGEDANFIEIGIRVR